MAKTKIFAGPDFRAAVVQVAVYLPTENTPCVILDMAWPEADSFAESVHIAAMMIRDATEPTQQEEK